MRAGSAASRQQVWRVVLFLCVLCLAALASPRLAAAATCTWNGGTGDWSATANWSGCGGAAPGGADTAVIDAGSVNLPANVTVQTLDFAGGSIGGSGTLTITSAFNWSSGSLVGPGVTSVPLSATLTLGALGANSPSGLAVATLDNRTLDLAGDTAMHAGAGLAFGGSGPGVIDNTGVFDITGDASMSANANGGAIHNTGTGVFRKSGGAGTTTVPVPFTNDHGSIQPQVGTLRLAGGGAITCCGGVSQGATLDLAGGFEILQGASLSGRGTILIDGNLSATGPYGFVGTTVVNTGTVDFRPGGASFGNLTQAGGDLLLGDARLTGNFTRNAGSFSAVTGTVFFAGTGVQSMTLALPTTFNTVAVGSDTTLVETVAANNATLTGALSSAGTVRKTLPISGAGVYTFGLTALQLNLTDAGSVTSVTVSRVDQPHANLGGNVSSERYWTFGRSGTGGTYDLTLPVDIPPSLAQVCEYTGTGTAWDCARTSLGTATVTRAGLTGWRDVATSGDRLSMPFVGR